jgi:hypothetical protein
MKSGLVGNVSFQVNEGSGNAVAGSVLGPTPSRSRKMKSVNSAFTYLIYIR